MEVDCTLEFCWRNLTPSAVGQVNDHLYLGQVLHEEGLKDCGCFPLYLAQHKGEAPAALIPGRHCEGKSSINFSEEHCQLIDILTCSHPGIPKQSLLVFTQDITLAVCDVLFLLTKTRLYPDHLELGPL